MTHRLQQTAFIVIAALGLVFGAARVAHAFTYAPANGVSPDGSANLQDPDEQFDSTDNGKTYGVPGGVTMHFGTQGLQGSSTDDYNFNATMDRLSSPLGN
jgi:hypothetical protein